LSTYIQCIPLLITAISIVTTILASYLHLNLKIFYKYKKVTNINDVCKEIRHKNKSSEEKKLSRIAMKTWQKLT
jgi:uncharacterized membrane protein